MILFYWQVIPCTSCELFLLQLKILFAFYWGDWSFWFQSYYKSNRQGLLSFFRICPVNDNQIHWTCWTTVVVTVLHQNDNFGWRWMLYTFRKKTTPVQLYIVIILIMIFMNKFTFLNINEIFLCFVCLRFLSRYSVGGPISSNKMYFPTTEKNKYMEFSIIMQT